VRASLWVDSVCARACAPACPPHQAACHALDQMTVSRTLGFRVKMQRLLACPQPLPGKFPQYLKHQILCHTMHVFVHAQSYASIYYIRDVSDFCLRFYFFLSFHTLPLSHAPPPGETSVMTSRPPDSFTIMPRPTIAALGCTGRGRCENWVAGAARCGATARCEI
jgi:hypothetical protein